MNAIIDTSSLMALVRYYMPFDRSNKLKEFLKAKFEKRELIIIDEVYAESQFLQKGIILKEFDFINAKSNRIIRTDTLIPYRKFFNRLENDFCNQNIKRTLDEVKFERAKEDYLKTADPKMILHALKLKQESFLLGDIITIVSEETATANDRKVFKKIPEICSLIPLDCCTLPVLLKQHYNLNLSDIFT